MLKLICSFLVLVINANAFAGCLGEYQKKISEISGKMNPPRTTVIANVGAEAVVVGTLASVGTLTVGAAIALPAAAAGAGSYLIYLHAQKKSYTDVMLTLKQAEKQKGPRWEHFLIKLGNKKRSIDPVDARDALLRLDSEMVFCQQDDYKGTVKLINPSMVRKLVLQELGYL